MSSRTEFESLLSDRLLPEFCSDPSRQMDVSGFVRKSDSVAEQDARDFLRAWHVGLLTHQGRGQYLVGAGSVREQFFSSGLKAAENRTFTLWLEPIITVAAIGRLHLDHGWPALQLAAQSKDWAFDIVAMGSDGVTEIIAGEVKKACREIDELLELMIEFGTDPQAPEPTPGKARNAFKKMASLRRGHAPILWLVGPDRYEKVFNVNYSASGEVKLENASADTLAFRPV